MVEGKNCSNCGANLKFDPYSKLLVCPFCGLTETVTKKEEATLELVDECIAQEHFARAKALASELLEKNPDDPRFLVRLLCCALRAKTVAEGLERYKKHTQSAVKILQYPEWEELEKRLDEEDKCLVGRGKDYLEKCQEINLLSKEIADSKAQHQSKKYVDVRQTEKKTPVLKQTHPALMCGMTALFFVAAYGLARFMNSGVAGENTSSLGILIIVSVCAIFFWGRTRLKDEEKDLSSEEKPPTSPPMKLEQVEDNATAEDKRKEAEKRQRIEQLETLLKEDLEQIVKAEERIG